MIRDPPLTCAVLLAAASASLGGISDQVGGVDGALLARNTHELEGEREGGVAR